MKYLKYFKESVENNFGFDSRLINLIELKDRYLKNKMTNKSTTEYGNICRVLTEYKQKNKEKFKFLPNGIWEVKEHIQIGSDGINLTKGSIIYLNDGVFRYSTDKGVNFFFVKQSYIIGDKPDFHFNLVYLTFYRNIKKIEDNVIFHNLKDNKEPGILKMTTDMYGDGADVASDMFKRGFDD